MKVIKFRRLHKTNWEIALSEDHLRYKLDGGMAEVIMPEKNLFIRIFRTVFPLIGIEKQLSND